MSVRTSIDIPDDLHAALRQRESSGKRLTNDQIEELIRMNQRTSTVTERSDANGQGGLFGVEEMTRSLLPEKAIVSDYVRKQLLAEKKLFGAVSTQAAAERLGRAGNVIQARHRISNNFTLLAFLPFLSADQAPPSRCSISPSLFSKISTRPDSAASRFD